MRHAVVSLMKLVQVGVLAGCTYPPLPHVVVRERSSSSR
jgi:hypothetical protein